MKRWAVAAVLFFCVLGIFHKRIMYVAGQYLVVEDEPRKVDAIYVLSGNPDDRGKEAAKLFKGGWAKEVVCMGGETSAPLELYGIMDKTCLMTQKVLRGHSVPDSAIRLLPDGSSTFEEYESIVKDCKAKGYDDIMVVSSRFHTRRIHAFFRHRLLFEGINLCLRGAYEHAFTEEAWWKEETGLMFVNNEYIKMAYYFLRY